MSDKSEKEKLLPTSVRFTEAERADVERAAAGMSLSDYIRGRVLDPERAPPRRRNKAPVKDYTALAKVLALLGVSHIPNNLNQLARASNSGSLVLTPDIEVRLHDALDHIAEIRALIIRALGRSET